MSLLKNIFLFFSACIFISSSFVRAQNIEKHEAIAAFLYNFAKNITWKQESKISSFNFMIFGKDEELNNELIKLSKTKKIRDKSFSVFSSDDINKVADVHLIFVPFENSDKIDAIFNKIEGKSILLVTDSYSEKKDIMINFINTENGTLQFEINNANILNQGLKVNDDIILLGGTQVDVAGLYRKGQQTLRNMQKTIDRLKEAIKKLNDLSKRNNEEILKQKDSLNEQNKKIFEQDELFKKQTGLLQKLNNELLQKESDIKEKQNILFAQEQKILLQNKNIEKGKNELLRQQNKIKQQDIEIRLKKEQLKTKETKLNTQENLVYFLTIASILLISLIVSIYRSYRMRIRLTNELEQKVIERTNDLSSSNEKLIFELNERKKAEEELNRYKNNLEIMVDERTKELESAKEKAESADRLKSAFLATMSHELRTPLNSIIGFTGILMKQIAGPLNDEQLKQLGMAKGSAKHLLDLINDVLDISKIEAGELVVSFQDFDFTKSLQKVVLSVQHMAVKKNLELTVHISEEILVIESDSRRVEQIFLNLINNSIKFTEIGYVKVESKIVNNFIETRIIDSGIGIKEEDMDKLFKPFSQVDTGITRNHEGTGLGLSICQRLVTKLGGTIRVESKIGVGSTFIVLLPIKQTENNLKV